MDTPNRMYYYAMLCNVNTLMDSVERDISAARKIINELCDDVYFNHSLDDEYELRDAFTRGYKEGYTNAETDIDEYNHRMD